MSNPGDILGPESFIDPTNRWVCRGAGGGCPAACCRMVSAKYVEHISALAGLEPVSLDRGDGVCKHLLDDKQTCGIYEDRPDICRVHSMKDRLNVPDELFDAFYAATCWASYNIVKLRRGQQVLREFLGEEE